ncbi:MAG: hypothetical protein JO060_10745 [Candidatus Eremiobacteraeota bacterium]|nr:hypothetical protein [Candidatus Eremiobacteraeota bacterium]MBV9647603.1 hypothetical protein [Candidatus Eremiobacteraeota bacterium]
MKRREANGQGFEVSVGFAADAGGAGVAYAAMETAGEPRLLRLPFFVRRTDMLEEREVGYAALRAVAGAIRKNYHGAIRFVVADEALVADLEERRPLPGALTMPYVALRCALNRFTNAEVGFAATARIEDLTARAKAEVSLHVAA